MKRKIQTLILVISMATIALPGFCLELTWEYESEVNDRLEKLQIYFETGMYDEAAQILTELISQFPDEPRFRYLKAIVDYQRGDYQTAEQVFLAFTKDYPEIAEPHYLLSEISLRKGDTEQAKEYLAKYCQLAPEDLEAQRKLQALSIANVSNALILHNGQEDKELVKKLGFYGACVSAQERQSLKLINGSFRTWSCMGIDFSYPLDLRGKQIVLILKGKKGGERLELTFRDMFAQDYNPQLVIVQEEGLSDQWQEIKVTPSDYQANIDLSCVVHMGLEFGFSTVQNPAQSTLYVRDIAIEDVSH